MHTNWHLRNFIRMIRSPANRSKLHASKGEKNEKTVLPLSERDLQELHEKNEKRNFYVSDPQHPSELPLISEGDCKPLVEMKHHDIENVSERKEKKFVHLQDLKIVHPLPEAPTIENQFEKITSAVTPLYMIPYKKQLKIKQRHCQNVLKQLRKMLKSVEAPVTSTMDKLPCPLEPIIPSPDILWYRNKDEFSVHVGVDGNSKTVGYFYGLPVDPFMRCIPPTPLVNIRDTHKLVAKHFQSFIRESPHETCLKFSEGGVWRNVIVRSTLKGELMAIVTIYPKYISVEEKEDIKNKLAHYFFRSLGAECNLSSLYLQACPFSKCSREMAPFELIEGAPYLVEECLGRKFRISPDSFFQTNTRAAELLYDSIKKVTELSPLSTLLDVCCGTGIISTFLGSQCRGTIGIDVSAGSIEDAKINAKQNGITNAQYIQGKIEKVLPLITRDLECSTDVVAVVNPARSGLHPSVIESIRRCESIKKLVYVTCKPEGNAMHNMAMLGSTVSVPRKLSRLKTINPFDESEKDLGEPFALRYAIPIDLFPHTAHVEYVLLFERFQHHM